MANPDAALRIVTHTARKARDWNSRRNRAIRGAYDEGASLRAIAEAAGVSHGTVDNIVKRTPPTIDVGEPATGYRVEVDSEPIGKIGDHSEGLIVRLFDQDAEWILSAVARLSRTAAQMVGEEPLAWLVREAGPRLETKANLEPQWVEAHRGEIDVDFELDEYDLGLGLAGGD